MSDFSHRQMCCLSLVLDEGEEAKDGPAFMGLERLAALYEVMHMYYFREPRICNGHLTLHQGVWRVRPGQVAAPVNGLKRQATLCTHYLCTMYYAPSHHAALFVSGFQKTLSISPLCHS